jgi:adenylate cyclase
VERTGSFKAARTKNVTILFADLVGFTSWSEKMAAEELAALLNRFFTLCSDAIFSQNGTVDKFIGDAAMAFFGRPDRSAGPRRASRGGRAQGARRSRDLEPRSAPKKDCR